jgi:hypothetical protein
VASRAWVYYSQRVILENTNPASFGGKSGMHAFFSVIFTQMLLFGGASHTTSLYEPSLIVITVEVVMIWCLVLIDAVCIIRGIQSQKNHDGTFRRVNMCAAPKPVSTPELNKNNGPQLSEAN